MTGPEHEQQEDSRVLYAAKMLIALELRRTHGIVFAAAFLDEFAPEVCKAAVKLAMRPRHGNNGFPSD